MCPSILAVLRSSRLRIKLLAALLFFGVLLFWPAAARAEPVSPIYTTTYSDAVTGDNSFTANDGKRYWTIDVGADSYQNEFYERPTVQNYQVRTLPNGSERFASPEYFGNLDIVQAKAGFDSQFLYVSIDLFSRNKSTSDGIDTVEGLLYRYDIRLSDQADGSGGFLLTGDQPELKNTPNTTYGQVGTFGYKDTNGDVGGSGAANGLSITKEDDPAAALGNGFETVVISDGKIQGTNTSVLWMRLDPNDNTIVEYAFDYKTFGLSEEYIRT